MKFPYLLTAVISVVTFAIQLTPNSAFAGSKFTEIRNQFRKPSSKLVMIEMKGSFRGRCYSKDDTPQGMILTTSPFSSPYDGLENYKVSAIEYFDKPYTANDSMTIEEVRNYWRSPYIKSEFGIEPASIMNASLDRNTVLSVQWGTGFDIKATGDLTNYRKPSIALQVRKNQDGIYYGRRLIGYDPGDGNFAYNSEQYCLFNKRLSIEAGL